MSCSMNQLCQRWHFGSPPPSICSSSSHTNQDPILVRNGPWSLCNQTTSWAEERRGLETVVSVHQVCLRRWKHSLRLIPSDFLVTHWAKLCLMNALMGSMYCEECRTGCPCGSRFDMITQIFAKVRRRRCSQELSVSFTLTQVQRHKHVIAAKKDDF